MKILFVCGCLEEGKDGIGDYTRKFARECMRQGVSPMVVAVNDGYVLEVTTGVFAGIAFYRLPQRLSWKQKADEMMQILNANPPVDWISIQFQPYAFSKKGLIKKALPFFKQLVKGHKTHVMMHELWVAEEREASMKMKIWGAVQKLSIVSFVNKINPAIVQTSIPLYGKMLALAGVECTILPLFSNIAYAENGSEIDNASLSALRINREQYIIGCLFGSIYHESWDLSSLFTILKTEKDRSGKDIMVVSIGKISDGKEFWKKLPAAYPSINFLTLGPQDENTISWWLKNFVDFGIVTTPAIIAGKSGSCMAFIEHGIPVLCKANDLSFNFDVSDDLIDKRVMQIDEGSAFLLPPRKMPLQSVKSTVQSFIQILNNTL